MRLPALDSDNPMRDRMCSITLRAIDTDNSRAVVRLGTQGVETSRRENKTCVRDHYQVGFGMIGASVA